MASYTVPGIGEAEADKVRGILQERLVALSDLHLTLKHIHWNVVGENFIAVHEMIDPQVDDVRLFVDAIAERIATLGGEPLGTPGAIVNGRSWDDYSLNRAVTTEHLAALNVVYEGVVADQRKAINALEDLDLVSQDMLIGQADKLEMFHWFVRAHLEDKGGHLATEGARTEKAAAKQVRGRTAKRAAKKAR
ncbi:MAG: DNA starvation/stationary phase protection protein [Acidimicrobiia bacterium]|nr:DNA starvation/stationary phase protection protein [Acidimicrobiia bacterium]